MTAPHTLNASGADEVLVNGRFLGRPISGVERYGREMLVALDRLAASGRGPRLRVLVPRGTACDLPLSYTRVESVGRRGGHAWEQVDLACVSRGRQLISFANSGPVAHDRHLVVIHDAAPFRFPEAYGWRYRLWHRALGRMLARRARLATVSRFSQGELEKFLRVPTARIALVPNGSDHLAQVTPDPKARSRLGLDGRPYLLAVGSANRNKNLAAVLAAWSLLPRGAGRLVLVGSVNQRIFSAIGVEPQSGVIITGHVTDETLAALYVGAAAFVFPSRYEGFGIPPLEAMAYGAPVIASNIAPVREVCGDAAQYFEPDDVSTLAAYMSDALSNPARNVGLAARAATRLALFRWEASARALLQATV